MTDGIGPERLFEPPPSLHLTLADRFLVPPFSVLDARAGYWQSRKRDWLELGLEGEVGAGGPPAGRAGGLLGGLADAQQRSAQYKARDAQLLGETGRGEQLLSSGTPRAGYGGDYDLSEGENAWGGAGTSIFDPVLCELAYRWYSPQGGHVLDPFAGGSVRGVVAAALGRAYTGIDLRAEQVQANEEQRDHIGAQHEWEHQPSWLLGDARDVGVLCAGMEFDFLFTCPPYYDLEVYGDDPRDLSRSSSYQTFRSDYGECIYRAAQLLRDNRFAAIVVGEVRDKQGHYHGLVPDTIRAFEVAGLRLYNEAILVTSVGSLPIRVSRAFPRGRKLGKSHQNLLIFLKGDAQLANDACGPVGVVAVEEGVEAWDAEGTVVEQAGNEQRSRGPVSETSDGHAADHGKPF